MAAAAQPEFVEVRCAGCGETLEVEPGLTEFACPDCGTQQALPPELMPPPPRRPRRALPLPGRGPPSAVPAPVPVPAHVPAPARMPCGGCGALLSVPAGLGRFACPLCSVELVVDGGRLRLYFASPAAPMVSVVARPLAGVTLTVSSLRQRPELQTERHHPIRSEQTPAQCPIRSVPREETFSSFRTDSRAAVQHTLARKEPVNHSSHRGESCIETLDKTTARSSSRKARMQAGVESIYMEEVQPERPIQESTPQAQACPPSSSVCRDHTQGQQPLVNISSREQWANNVSSTMEQEKTEPLNQACGDLKKAQAGKTTGWNPKRKRSSKNVGENKKRNNKGFLNSPNDGFLLRRSKRLTKQPEQPINDDPVQQAAAPPNQYNTDPPDIDRLIANLCPSPLPRCQMPQASSSESGNADAPAVPAPSNRDMPQAEQFPHCYSQLYPPEVRDTHQLDKSCEQVQPQSPEQVVHAQQQDAHSYHPLLRSHHKSSGRGRGRCPTRLIEPRREFDRPVLTPNNTDNWDVNPLCPKVASTITALLKQKYPGSTYLPVGQHGDVPVNGEVVYRWKQYPLETRAAILNEFLQRYKWAPGQEAESLKIFERRAVKQFTGLLCEEKRRVRAELAAVKKAKKASGFGRSNRHAELEEEDAREGPNDNQTDDVSEDEDPIQWKPFPPAWMYPNWWERLCEYWAKEEVLKMSLQYRKNRFVGGRAHHTSGSRSFAMQRQLMVIENGGKPVSELEIFNKTHKFNGGTGEFVSEKAKRIVEGFKKRMEEAGDKPVDPDVAWVQQVGGRNRGRYYGLTGTIDKAKIEELAKSIPGKRGQQQKFSQEQVQQMINQALQGLNQTWEEKFKSLEQSVHGAPLLGVDPEHAPGSSAAGRDVQQDQSRYQDASDSHHGERSQSARHDEDYEEEEVVSTSV
ncbi:hypothetical protein E2562_033826 [Oryza meyeriana var. granulata]|uniref:Uncharacterized protein n=1 Tax=Oryza meyeriana var. granulata TaxID=110450 RepID=A0A6G1F179_9ORYZ|nr:hypothetical protein E2562_033826 [Oryza meyeriana var. granulata]KAF0930633.1 hypothetical protein E2562_033826 [Oryza meyeriana var. granulata]KAF0930636.1 hypothetical protein E2562_033826 [Oryza meyeriana var. granulata]